MKRTFLVGRRTTMALAGVFICAPGSSSAAIPLCANLDYSYVLQQEEMHKKREEEQTQQIIEHVTGMINELGKVGRDPNNPEHVGTQAGKIITHLLQIIDIDRFRNPEKALETIRTEVESALNQVLTPQVPAVVPPVTTLEVIAPAA